MKTLWKAAAAAFALGTLALAVPAQAQPYGGGYYGNPYGNNAYGNNAYGNDADDDNGYDDQDDGDQYADGDYGDQAYGYCDQYGCPSDYYDMPLYYGSVYSGDEWYNGPFYYRDWGGRRQYWVHGGWRNDEWRGERPYQYRSGHYGPALGLNWYRSHNQFRQGWNGARGFDRHDGFNRNNGFNRRDDGHGWYAGRDNRQGFGRDRGSFDRHDDLRNDAGRSFGRDNNWRNQGGFNNAWQQQNRVDRHDNGFSGNRQQFDRSQQPGREQFNRSSGDGFRGHDANGFNRGNWSRGGSRDSAPQAQGFSRPSGGEGNRGGDHGDGGHGGDRHH